MVDAEEVWQMLLLVTASAIFLATTVFFVQFPKTRAHPGPVLICLILSSCCAMVFRAATHLTASRLAATSTIGNAHAVETTTTVVLFWLTLYFTSATTFWYLMLAMDLISSLSNPFLPFQSNNLIHHSLAWPLAGAWCLVYNFTVYWKPQMSPLHLRIIIVLPLYCVLVYIFVALRAAWAKACQLPTQAHETTRRMARLIQPYLMVFLVTGGIYLVVFIAELAHGSPTLYSSYMDQLTGIVSCIVLFVLFYFDSGVGLCRPLRARSRSRMPTLVASPQEIELAGGTRSDSAHVAVDFDVDIAAELRKMVMTLTRMGIVSAAECDAKDAVEGRIPKSDDFITIERKSISYFGSSDALGDVLVFEDVAPVVFHSLRELYGIDQATYLHAFDPEENLREICSEGKSGNIFYFTANKQFMVKSVPKDEFDVLRSILPHYYDYVVQNRDSYLCRYFGCHSITLPVGTRKMYFVVMHNLFSDGPVHQRYDLKGNTDRRQAIPSADVEFTMRETVQRKSISKLMMDIDFSRIHQCMQVTETDALAMKTQLKRDINFLISQHIMDYSILVGVQHLEEMTVTRVGSSVPSRDGMNLYSMGIIDMLQKYNWRWMVQRWFLGCVLCKDTSDVSAVPPATYGRRLIAFIQQNMFNQARRESRSSLFSPLHTHPLSESGIALSHRPSGYLQFSESGLPGNTPATEMWLATNLSDEIMDMEMDMDIHDCVILQED